MTDISLDCAVYHVVLRECVEEDVPIIYHVVNSIAPVWKFVFKPKIYCVQILSTSFTTKVVIKYQYFHTGSTVVT